MSKLEGEEFYVRRNGRYVRAGSHVFRGFPCDGLWLVQTKPNSHGSKCIMQLQDADDVHMPTKVSLEMFHDEACKGVREMWDKHKNGVSISETVDAVFTAVALAVGQKMTDEAPESYWVTDIPRKEGASTTEPTEKKRSRKYRGD